MSILDRLLKGYPNFYYRESDGNHYKHNSVLAQEFDDFNIQTILVKYLHNLDRPLKIWRNQYLPYQHEMRYQINLENIKRVKFYAEEIDTILLQDSRVLDIGTNNYSNRWTDETYNLYPIELWKFEDNYLPNGLYLPSSPNVSYDFSTFNGKSCLDVNLISDIAPWWNGYIFAIGMVDTDGYGTILKDRLGAPLKPGKDYIHKIKFYTTAELSFYTRAQALNTIYDIEGMITSATIDDEDISVGSGGDFMVTIPPGQHTVTLHISTPLGLPYYIIDSEWMKFFDEGDSGGDKLYLFSMQLTPVYTEESHVIPTKKYYLEVETYDGYLFQKGFPENDEIQRDIYDHDSALDMIGYLFDVPRRIFKTDIDEVDYPRTVPPYNISQTEWDACYEKRIREHMQDYQTLPLPSVELKKYFDILPLIENRARYVTKMNKDVMGPEDDAKYMATKNWNSSVFNVGVNFNNVPANIDVPSVETIQSLLDRTFPISKKAIFTLMAHYPDLEKGDPPLNDMIGLIDGVSFKLNFPLDAVGLIDNVNLQAEIPINENILGLIDQVKFKIMPPWLDLIGLIDTVNMTALIPTLTLVTNSDFNAGSLGTGIIVSSNSVQLDTAQKNTSKFPTVVDQVTGDGADDYGWSNLNNIKANDNVLANVGFGGDGWSYWIRGKSFGFGLASNVTITGLEIRSEHKQVCSTSGQKHWWNMKLWVGNDSTVFQHGPSTSQSIIYQAEGGNGNILGIVSSQLTPSNVNSLMVGLATSGYSSAADGYCDYVFAIVYWRYASGGYTTPTITVPTDDSSWNKIVIDHTIPSGCSITYDILRASDNAVLLSGQTGSTIDISSLPLVDLKVKATLIANGTTTPKINSITAYTKKTLA